jgi:hypothetical protein
MPTPIISRPCQGPWGCPKEPFVSPWDNFVFPWVIAERAREAAGRPL